MLFLLMNCVFAEEEKAAETVLPAATEEVAPAMEQPAAAPVMEEAAPIEAPKVRKKGKHHGHHHGNHAATDKATIMLQQQAVNNAQCATEAMEKSAS